MNGDTVQQYSVQLRFDRAIFNSAVSSVSSDNSRTPGSARCERCSCTSRFMQSIHRQNGCACFTIESCSAIPNGKYLSSNRVQKCSSSFIRQLARGGESLY